MAYDLVNHALQSLYLEYKLPKFEENEVNDACILKALTDRDTMATLPAILGVCIPVGKVPVFIQAFKAAQERRLPHDYRHEKMTMLRPESGREPKPQCKYGSACYSHDPSHRAKYDHSAPPITVNGKEWTMYHGTSQAAAIQIKRGGVHGLQPQPSTSGMLGAGVYCSRELVSARAYATGNGHTGGGVVFELRVRPGKIKAIRSMGHPLRQTWHQAGYDTAWVPPGVVNGTGEDCVWDPQRVRIVGVAWSDCGFTW